MSGLQSYELWIVGIGALCGAACGLLGSFLLLRRAALLGDAISHAVLPGIALAVMATGEVSSFPVLLGAGALGLLTPLLVDLLQHSGRVREDAALGAVFTSLFAAGVILVTSMGSVHVDAECVLLGDIATTPFDGWIVGDRSLGPRAAWTLGGVLAADLALVTLCYKELQVSTFDEGLAAAMGFRPRLVHYLLMGAVAVTSVASFEVVGAVLVVAMLTAPAAAAHLLTDRLGVMLAIAAGLGAATSAAGYGLARGLGGDVSIAGCMAAAAGAFFTLAFLFSPSHGVLVRAWRRRGLARRLLEENLVVGLFREEEAGRAGAAEPALTARFGSSARIAAGVERLVAAGLALRQEGRLRLTPTGLARARALVRGHRLWETYLHRLGLPPDHLHRSADAMEHFLSDSLRREMEEALEHPTADPHGKPIPRA